MGCLDENAIVDFAGGHVTGEAALRLAAHVDSCEACRVLVAAASSSLPRTSEGVSEPVATTSDPSLSDVSTEQFVRLPRGLVIGNLLADRFRLKRLLGRGGMGQVYAAHDELLKVDVAVKILLPELASRKGYMKQLHREIVIARSISHPNVCRVHDLGHHDGVHFITMELINGRTLDAAMKERLSAECVAEILRQIAAGLAAAHKVNVVHRDLKPSNIMLDASRHLRILDFGLAGYANAEATQGMFGTPAYWSPEQTRGEGATAASDVYVVGLLACRLFSGDRKARPDAAALANVPSSLRAVVAKCVEYEPSRRFASAWELSRALNRAGSSRSAFALYGILLVVLFAAVTLAIRVRVARDIAPAATVSALPPAVPSTSASVVQASPVPVAGPTASAAPVGAASSAPRRAPNKEVPPATRAAPRAANTSKVTIPIFETTTSPAPDSTPAPSATGIPVFD